MSQSDPLHPTPRFLTVPQFASKHPWATIGGLRWQRFNCDKNGLKSAFVTIGRKVLIDEDEYFQCVARLNGQSRESR